MKSLKKILLTTALVSSTLLLAQQPVVIKDLPSTYTQDYVFSGSWGIKADNTNNVFVINGSQIINASNTRSNELELSVYFVPVKTKHSINKLPNQLNHETKLGEIDGNMNSFNNVRIEFTQKEIANLAPGVYSPVLVLKEKKTGNIKNYKVLDNTFEYANNQLQLTKKDENTYLLNGEKIDETLSNVYSTVKSDLSLAYNPDQLVLAGEWKLDVNFETLTVMINGENNSIQNKTSEKTNKLKLLVYFSEQEPNQFQTVEGYELLTVDVKPISKLSEIKNTKIKTNITKPLPRGEYYPILVLTEADEFGAYKVKSAIKFKEKYTL